MDDVYNNNWLFSLKEQKIAKIDLKTFRDNDANELIIGTHNSRFHCDDVSATSIIYAINETKYTKIYVIRSRSEECLKLASLVYDVPCESSPNRIVCDHHGM